jgi:HEPN domain-containing protein
MPKPDTLEWLDKASEDEAAVRILRAAGGPWSIAAYHVQQAAEKYVKAALVEAGIAPPKSHDVSYLLTLHPASVSASVHNSASATSVFAWATRYPGGPAIADSHVAAVEQDLAVLKAWALSQVI